MAAFLSPSSDTSHGTWGIFSNGLKSNSNCSLNLSVSDTASKNFLYLTRCNHDDVSNSTNFISHFCDKENNLNDN